MPRSSFFAHRRGWWLAPGRPNAACRRTPHSLLDSSRARTVALVVARCALSVAGGRGGFAARCCFFHSIGRPLVRRRPRARRHEARAARGRAPALTAARGAHHRLRFRPLGHARARRDDRAHRRPRPFAGARDRGRRGRGRRRIRRRSRCRRYRGRRGVGGGG